MPAPQQYVELIQRLFHEVDPTITVERSHNQLDYAFEIVRGGDGYEFNCPRRPLDDGDLDELRRLRDQFLLSHLERPTDLP